MRSGGEGWFLRAGLVGWGRFGFRVSQGGSVFRVYGRGGGFKGACLLACLLACPGDLTKSKSGVKKHP